MKNILLLIGFILFSCKSQKKSEIIYFLPFPVKQKLAEKIKTINDKDISFTLDNDNMGNLIIYLNEPKKNEYQFWIKNTNRVIFVDGNLYPLVFKSDEYFSYPEEKKLVLKKISEESVLTSIIAIRDNVFHVKFNLNGEIIK